MTNHKVTLAYDGTCYSGFQLQKNANSIQAEVEKGLSIIYGSAIRINGAGRTDSGVHARGQVFSFHADDRVPAQALPQALKGLLPRDIVVWRGEQVHDEFHARYHAKKKEYCYTIDNAPLPDVFLRKYAYHYPGNLDVQAMQAAAVTLAGEHDFSSFRAMHSNTRGGNVRHVEKFQVVREKSLIRIHILANGFLYKMVRIMVGTLLRVGEGRIAPGDMEIIVASRRRSRAGPTAPPHGLCLERVYY